MQAARGEGCLCVHPHKRTMQCHWPGLGVNLLLSTVGAMRALLLVPVLLATVVFCRADERQAPTRILASLASGEEIVGLKIVANETTLSFNGNSPVAHALESGPKLAKEVLDKLAAFPAPDPDVTSNTCVHTYLFQADRVFVTMNGVNPQTKQIGEHTLATSNAVFTWRSFLATGGDTNGACLGEAYLRVGNGPVGWPCFLTKRGLAEWIAQSPELRCELEAPSQGAAFYAITLPPPTPSPLKSYRLRIRADDLNPVELSCYSQDGSLYSTSELEFQGGEHSSICKRARTRVFSGSAVFTESIWEVAKIEKVEPSVVQDADSFFPEGTRVSDLRFAKPIVYRQGSRPPNVSEVRAMLEGPRGAVKYEATTHSKAQLAELLARRALLQSESRTRKKLVRILLCVSLLVPLALGISVWHGRRKRQSAT